MTIYFLKYFFPRVWLGCEHPMPTNRETDQPQEPSLELPDQLLCPVK